MVFQAVALQALGLPARLASDQVAPAISAVGSTTSLDTLEQMPDHLADRRTITRRGGIKVGLAAPIGSNIASPAAFRYQISVTEIPSA